VGHDGVQQRPGARVRQVRRDGGVVGVGREKGARCRAPTRVFLGGRARAPLPSPPPLFLFACPFLRIYRVFRCLKTLCCCCCG
jgi:hypothetical protein